MSVTAVPLQPVKSTYKIWLWLGVIAAIAAAFGLAWIGTGEQRARAGTNEQFLAWNKSRMGVQTTASGLQYQVLKEGTGPTAADQDGIGIEVYGVKRNGEEFQPKAPMQFRIGQQAMIPGFTEGVKLMNKGAKFRFWLPPSIGYGAAPAQPGQPNPLATEVLIFDVDMKELVPAATLNQMLMQQMMQQGVPGQGGPEGPAPGGEAPQQ